MSFVFLIKRFVVWVKSNPIYDYNIFRRLKKILQTLKNMFRLDSIGSALAWIS